MSSRLSDADRLDEDDVHPERIQEARDVPGRARDAAVASTRRHTADEDAGIEEVCLHPDAVAENRPAAERARRIDGGDPDPPLALPQVPGQPLDERRFARRGRPRDADDVGPACARVDPTHDVGHAGRPALDEGHEARERRSVARQHTVDELVRPHDLEVEGTRDWVNRVARSV